MTKKVLAIVLASLMTLCVFVGCNNTSGTTSSTPDTSSNNNASTESKEDENTGVVDLGTEDNITLKVAGPAAQQDVLKAQVEAFKKLYPNKTMTIDVVVGEENNAKTDVLNDIAAAADVFAFPSDQISDFVSAGALSAVRDYADVTAANAESSVKAATIDGKLVAYPLAADNTYVLFYDKRVFSDEDVKSLDKMVEVAKNANKSIYIDAGNGFYACAFSFTGGLRIDHNYENNTENHTFTSDKAAAVASLKAFGELFKSGAMASATVQEGISALSSGKAAAVVDGTWDATAIKEALGEENMGCVCLPSVKVNGTDMPMVSLFGFKFLGVKSQTAFPTTAHALAKFLSGETCQAEKAEKLSVGPSNIAASKLEAVTNNIAVKAVADQVANSVPQTTIAGGFWNAHQAVGTYLAAGTNDLSDAALEKLLDDCMEATNE